MFADIANLSTAFDGAGGANTNYKAQISSLMNELDFDGALRSLADSLGRPATLDEALQKLSSYQDGCSWYCGGSLRVAKASSVLAAAGKIDYDSGNAHDFDALTAWVEGVEGDGVGEYIDYWLLEGPPLNAVRILNGYTKNERVWKSNSRIKTLKMLIEGKVVAMLQLQDTRDWQRFNLGREYQAGSNDSLQLRFEIVEVYKGSKYSDTALTELSFDGTGVHCFAAGTLVAMADGRSKPIERIGVGDRILSLNPETRQKIETRVLGLFRVSITICIVLDLPE